MHLLKTTLTESGLYTNNDNRVLLIMYIHRVDKGTVNSDSTFFNNTQIIFNNISTSIGNNYHYLTQIILHVRVLLY